MKKATLPEGPPAIKEPGWKGFKSSSSTWNKKDSSQVYVPVTWKKGLVLDCPFLILASDFLESKQIHYDNITPKSPTPNKHFTKKTPKSFCKK